MSQFICIISNAGGLIHKDCGGEIARKRTEKHQFIFCKTCGRGKLTQVPEFHIQGADVKTQMGERRVVN